MSSNLSLLVVSVPVLSRHRTSTLLSDSTALACCTSAPWPRNAHCAERVGDGDRDEEAVGHQADDHGGLLNALRQRQRLDQAVHDDEDLEIDHHEQQHADGQVDLLLQRRQDAAIGPGALGQLPGHAVLPHPRHGEVARAAGDERTRADLIAHLLAHEVGLAGQLRLVDLERRRRASRRPPAPGRPGSA